MLPEEIKAKELIEKFKNFSEDKEIIKQCAIICCDEIINSFEKYVNKPLDKVYQDIRTPIGISQITEPYKIFWQKVKEVILKMML